MAMIRGSPMLILEVILWFVVAMCICMVAAKFMASIADGFFRANDAEYRTENPKGGAPPWWPLWWWSFWKDLGILLFAGLLILIILWQM